MVYVRSRFCRYRIRNFILLPDQESDLVHCYQRNLLPRSSGFQVLIWAMVNDAIDYQELTTGDRKEGMVYATYSFFRKLASAVSSSLSSFTLALIGYNVNEAVQTAAVKAHIWKSYTAIYAIGYLIAVLILYFVYPLSKKKTEEMLETLAKKRAKQGE